MLDAASCTQTVCRLEGPPTPLHGQREMGEVAGEGSSRIIAFLLLEGNGTANVNSTPWTSLDFYSLPNCLMISPEKFFCFAQGPIPAHINFRECSFDFDFRAVNCETEAS